jgi:hypothetical protein
MLFKPDALAPKTKTKHNNLRVTPQHQGQKCGTCAYWGRKVYGGACYERNEWVDADYPACSRWMADAWRGREKPA